MRKMNKKIILKSLLFMTSLVALVSCQSKSVETRDYDNYDHTLVADVFSHDEDDYVVYLYRRTCGTCEDVKSKVFDFVDRLKDEKSDLGFYFLEYQRQNENPNNDVLVNLTRFDDSPFVDENGDIKDGLYDEMFDTIKSSNVGVTDVKDMTYYFTPCLYEIKSVEGVKTIVDVVIESDNVVEWINGR